VALIAAGTVDTSHLQSCVFDLAALPEAFEAARPQVPEGAGGHVSRPMPT